MALVTFSFESKYLRNGTDVSIILPDRPRGCDPETFYANQEKYKVMFLLHGTFGEHDNWLRNSLIELYACEKNLIVVMPGGLNTNYRNWDNFGCGYYEYDFIVKELMPIVHNWFPASSKREDNFIAGLSMGSRGAMYLGLTNPDKFGGIAALSAFPRDISLERDYYIECMTREYGNGNDFASPFEPEFRARRMRNEILMCANGDVDKYIEMCNPMNYLKDYVASGYDTKIYCACGMDDVLYPEYLGFQKIAADLGIKAHFEAEAGYKHEWRFWNKYIEKAIEFFGMTKVIGGRDLAM